MRYYPDELYHFGVKGMKWGVRRNRSRGSDGKKLTPEQRAARKARLKKAGKIAANAAGLALIGAGIYAQHKSGKRLINAGDRVSQAFLGRGFTSGEFSTLNGANRRRTAKTVARVGAGLGALALSEKLRKQSYEAKNGVDAANKRRASRVVGIAGGLTAPAVATLPYAAYRFRDNDKRFRASIDRNTGGRKRRKKRK